MYNLNIYLDLNNYYRVFDDQNQFRIKREANAVSKIFELIDSNKFKLCGSFVLENENNNNTYLKNKLHIQLIFSKWSFNIGFETFIIEKTKKIIELSNAGTYDALHLVCAACGNCEYFITCDDRFIKTINANIEKLHGIIGRIKMFNPCDFIEKEMENNEITRIKHLNSTYYSV